MSGVVAIHQPNFFPWLGFFDKMAKSDVFVLLDNVQFPKSGAGGWTNRVKVVVSGEVRWLTAPVDRDYHGLRQIREMRFQKDPGWRKKSLKTLELNYRRAPNFDAVMALIGPLLLNPDDNVAAYNEHAIRSISAELGIAQEKIRRASDLPGEGSSNELLISLTRASGGTVYMCGGGADGYQDQATFDRAGMTLAYQRFEHPTYPQHGQKEFHPGLSVIDALANVGTAGLRKLLSLAA